MKTRWMVSLGVLVLVAPFTRGQAARLGPPAPSMPAVGQLVSRATFLDGTRPKPILYEPQPGDIVLYDDFNKLYHFVFKFANTSAPTHAAMVIAREDGTPALLELTGPKMIFAKVVIMDVETRFRSYPGTIMVRRVRAPLTEEHSKELTHFAQTQSGKSFALGRVLLQATLFSPRHGLRRELFGRTYPTRDRWFCSEMVVAACASAHVLDAKAHCANATYPRDLAYDETVNLAAQYHPPLFWTPAER